MATEFKWPVRVYIEDTDAGGIVYYVNYLKFMERARTEFLRHLGFDHAEMIQQGSMVVIHSAQIRYAEPALLDDELEATVSISELKRSYLIFEQKIFRKETGDLLAHAEIKGACVKKEGMRPCAMPTEMHAALGRFLAIKQES